MDGELIPVSKTEIDGIQIDAVNARDIWRFVESKMEFANWIKGRLSSQLYKEGEDWVVDKLVNNPSGGRPSIDYLLTIDVAKEIGMAEHNAKGQQLRRWFIAREKKLAAIESSQINPMALLNDPAALRAMLLGYTEKVQVLETAVVKLESVVTEQTPKVDGFNLIAEAEGATCLMDTAKMLQIPPRQFIEKLAQMKWIFKRLGAKEWTPYQDKIHQGLMVVKVKYQQKSDGTTAEYPQGKVTAKGLSVLSLRFGKKQQDLFSGDAAK